MSNFNLQDYETVKQRKARFYQDHVDGRIIVSLVNPESILEYALFRVEIFLSDKMVSSGYAMEIRDKELSVSNNGKMFESVNYSSWTENAEESAVGRALDNFGYSSNGKCSREEIEKAQRQSATIKKQEQKHGDKYSFVGGKYAGKKYSEIDRKELISYCDFLENADSKKYGSLIKNIDAYLKESEKPAKNPQDEFGPLT